MCFNEATETYDAVYSCATGEKLALPESMQCKKLDFGKDVQLEDNTNYDSAKLVDNKTGCSLRLAKRFKRQPHSADEWHPFQSQE
eukprot:2521831-Lingulodinium_polyedra.AAC.1